jgi:hypothetical protein
VDSKLESDARETLMRMFPKIPEESVQPVLDHTLKKRSGRVGRSKTRPFDECISLAVRAHIRHHHTNYDTLLQHQSMNWRDARERVGGQVNKIVNAWGAAVETNTGPTMGKLVKGNGRSRNIRHDREGNKHGPRVNWTRRKPVSEDRRRKHQRLKKKESQFRSQQSRSGGFGLVEMDRSTVEG